MASGAAQLTEKGRQAVQNMQSSLTARCRSILVQVDGKRSLDDLLKTFRGLDGLDEAVAKLISEGYILVTRDCRDMVKETAQKLLGVKSAMIVRKIDEMHAKYGDACWDHIDELDKAARLFYGENVAQDLKRGIEKVLNEMQR